MVGESKTRANAHIHSVRGKALYDAVDERVGDWVEAQQALLSCPEQDRLEREREWNGRVDSARLDDECLHSLAGMVLTKRSARVCCLSTVGNMLEWHNTAEAINIYFEPARRNFVDCGCDELYYK